MERDKKGEPEITYKGTKTRYRGLLNLRRRNIQKRRLRLNAHRIPEEIKNVKKETIAGCASKFWNVEYKGNTIFFTEIGNIEITEDRAICRVLE